jgi:hypothetical protein
MLDVRWPGSDRIEEIRLPRCTGEHGLFSEAECAAPPLAAAERLDAWL